MSARLSLNVDLQCFRQEKPISGIVRITEACFECPHHFDFVMAFGGRKATEEQYLVAQPAYPKNWTWTRNSGGVSDSDLVGFLVECKKYTRPSITSPTDSEPQPYGGWAYCRKPEPQRNGGPGFWSIPQKL